MFTSRKNRIDSDEGFTIEFDRDRLHYLRRDLRIRLNHEMLPRGKAVAIWRDSITDLNPTVGLTASQSDAIIQDIIRAFRAIGYDVTLI
jgi:hypothetical protein